MGPRADKKKINSTVGIQDLGQFKIFPDQASCLKRLVPLLMVTPLASKRYLPLLIVQLGSPLNFQRLSQCAACKVKCKAASVKQSAPAIFVRF
jgi:hypothetical protein